MSQKQKKKSQEGSLLGEQEFDTDQKHIIKQLSDQNYAEKKKATVREPIQNSWDADAQNVWIEKYKLGGDVIIIEDDGHGMGVKELKEYLKIGGSTKRNIDTSEEFDRKVIGNKGIGRLSAFLLGNKFIAETKQGDYERTVNIDRDTLEEKGILTADVTEGSSLDHDGVKLIIDDLKDIGEGLTVDEIESVILNTYPKKITSENFNIYINGDEVKYEIPDGDWYDVDITHDEFDWHIDGEVLIADKSVRSDIMGIHQQHSSVTVTKGFLGVRWYNHITRSNRLYGTISADFLELTSGRESFIKDDGYEWFENQVSNRLKEILDLYEEEQKQQIIEEDMDKIEDIVRAFKDILEEQDFEPPKGDVPVNREHVRKGEKTKSHKDLTRKDQKEDRDDEDGGQKKRKKRKKRKQKVREYTGKIHTPDGTEEKTMNNLIEDIGIGPKLVQLGEDGPHMEFKDNPAIPQINVDHPLYISARENNFYDFYISSLIARIISEINSDEVPEAFENYHEQISMVNKILS